MQRIYLAGPDVFLPDAKILGKRKREICARYGFEGVFPFDQNLNLAALSPPDQGRAIFTANQALMDGCDLCIAHCTPFRAPSMDVGTAIEIGYMSGQGKIVWGYTNITSNYADRIVCSDGMEVEAFDMADNLMIEGIMEASGGRLTRVQAPVGRLYTWLAGFEACVRAAASLA